MAPSSITSLTFYITILKTVITTVKYSEHGHEKKGNNKDCRHILGKVEHVESACTAMFLKEKEEFSDI